MVSDILLWVFVVAGQASISLDIPCDVGYCYIPSMVNVLVGQFPHKCVALSSRFEQPLEMVLCISVYSS